MKRKILSIFMTLVLVLTLAPALCAEAQAAAVGAMPSGQSGVAAGDTVYFGSADGAPIAWRVLDTKIDAGTDGLFLLSEALFDGGAFDKAAPYSNAWDGSDAQSWCEDFAGEAFTAGELWAIFETDKAAGTSDVYDIEWSDAALNDDKVFFLSAAELAEYISAANDDSKLVAKLDGEAAPWWLRSARKDGTLDAGVVTDTGKVVYGQAYLNWAARPAMNLWDSYVVSTSPAVGGKADAVDGTLSTIGTEKPDAWKVTVFDPSRPMVTAAPANGGSGFTVTVNGGKVALNYSGALLGANEYVSVLLMDANDNFTHYGRIANNTASGTAEIEIPALPAGDYSLAIFNEQCNGDYATDYTGALLCLPLTVILNPQDAPEATFTATGDSTGVLSGLEVGTKYSTDGGSTWTTADGDTAQLTGVSAANDIKLYIPGDGTSTDDSEEQTIDVTQSAAPEVTKTDCTDADNNDGTISGVDSTMEYKKMGDAQWAPITGEKLSALEPGTYLVRVKASGSVLASNAKSVVIDQHYCDPDNDWKRNETHHWLECACGEEFDRGEHEFGDWTVTKEAEGKKDGEKQRVCEVCKYEDTEVIPAPAPETGDHNMLWVLAVLLSGLALAGALIYGRKSKLLTKIFSLLLAGVMALSLVLPYAETAQAAAGDSSYIGYDGYIWSGKDRTDVQLVDLTADNVPENTIGLYENAYYPCRVIDLAREQVALTSTYLPLTGQTAYSGTKLTALSVATTDAGTLTVGVVDVDTLVAARADGSAVKLLNAVTLDVVKGINELTFDEPIAVGNGQTIVLGSGGDTAKLAAYAGIDRDDDLGTFASLGAEATGMADLTDGVKDKLAIKTTVTVRDRIELTKDIRGAMADVAIPNMETVHFRSAPFAFLDKTLFAGKTINEIELPVQSVSAIDGNQYITAYIIDSASLKAGQAVTVKDTMQLKLPLSALEGCTASAVNKWITIDGLNIEVAEDETLAFCKSGDTVTWGFRRDKTDNENLFAYNLLTSTTNSSVRDVLSIAVYTYEDNYPDHLAILKDAEAQAMEAKGASDVDNTLPFFGEGTKVLDLASKQGALMNTFLPLTGQTAYSNSQLTKMVISAAEAGTMTVGAADVSDVVAARAAGTLVTPENAQQVQLVKGINVLVFSTPIAVGEGQTVVLGKTGDTAKLEVMVGYDDDAEDGKFATLGVASDTKYDVTDGVADKLVLRTTVSVKKRIELTKDVHGAMSDLTIPQMTSVAFGSAPFAFLDKTLFAGKTITEIDLPVKSVSAIDANQTITVYVIDAASFVTGGKVTVNETHTLTLPLSALQGCTASAVNKWITIDGLNIEVGADETLAFCKNGDTIIWGYRRDKVDNANKFAYNLLKTTTNSNAKDVLSIAVYTYDETLATHLKDLKDAEDAKRGEKDANDPENTLVYYGSSYASRNVDLSSRQAALMTSYMPTTQQTGYSGTTLTKLHIGAAAAGKMTVGVADVDDIIAARAAGNTVALSATQTFDLTAGINELTLTPIAVGAGQTLVLGSTGDTAKLEVVTGVTPEDEQGKFATLGVAATGAYDTTDGIADKLVIRTTVSVKNRIELTKDVHGAMSDLTIPQMTSVAFGSAPFAFLDKTLFAGKTITEIDLPVKSVSAIDANQTITVYVIDAASFVTGGKVTVNETHTLTLPLSALQGCTASAVNKWITIDGLNIEVGADETLAFCKNGDTIIWGYRRDKANNANLFAYNLLNTVKNSQATDVLSIAVYTYGDSYPEHLKDLKAAEEAAAEAAQKAALKVVLKDKNLSIFGDSISTYRNWSNNATDYNNTIGGNMVYYYDGRFSGFTVNDTYWKQLIDEYDMNLATNNSSSGSRVIGVGNSSGSNADQGWLNRPYNLHDNTGTTVNPDIISVYIGINDLNNSGNRSYPSGTFEAINFNTLIVANGSTYTYAEPTTVAEAYAVMIHKMTVTYPDAEIFIMNMPLRAATPSAGLTTYNDFIAKIADRFGATLVDLYNSPISGTAYNGYSVGDNLHPNAAGHDLMTEALLDAMASVYLD